MRGWENVRESDVQRFNRRVKESTEPKPSKYRNVRVSVQGQKFDSQREADQFLALRAREAGGEISQLRCQVQFDLECPIYSTRTGALIQCATVSRYVADFTWRDRDDVLHVADAKGVRTKEYRLKAKWMNLQFGIVVEEL